MAQIRWSGKGPRLTWVRAVFEFLFLSSAGCVYLQQRFLLDLWLLHAYLRLLLGEGVWHTTDEIELIDGWVEGRRFSSADQLIDCCLCWMSQIGSRLQETRMPK